MSNISHNANTPRSEPTKGQSAEPGETAALTGDDGREAACQPNGQPSDSDEEAVRCLAHSKWEAAGCPPGDGFDFWLQAEREVRAKQSGSNAAQG